MGFQVQAIACDLHIQNLIKRIKDSGGLEQANRRRNWKSLVRKPSPSRTPAINQCVEIGCLHEATHLPKDIIPFGRVVENITAG